MAQVLKRGNLLALKGRSSTLAPTLTPSLDDVTMELDDVTVVERDDVTVEERRFSAALGAPSTWALAPGVALTNGMRGNSRRRFAE